MIIRWDNVIIAGLAFFAFVIGILNLPEITAFLSSIRESHSPYATPEDKFIGLIAFALLAACILAALRIAIINKDK